MIDFIFWKDRTNFPFFQKLQIDVALLVSNSSLRGHHSNKLRIYQWLDFMIKVTDHEIYILNTKHMFVLLIVKHAVQQGSPVSVRPPDVVGRQPVCRFSDKQGGSH